MLRLSFLLAIWLCPVVLFAPPIPPGPGGGGPGATIDSGLILLLMAGALYGIRQIYKSKSLQKKSFKKTELINN